MVDLLSRHLYSGPQVYLRELIQNAVDAVTARREQDAGAPATIRLRTSVDADGGAHLEIADSGIGMTAEEAAELLATIGRSSKRDPVLGLGRDAFIGQFGIGMLAAFMVADRIVVHSRSASGTESMRWEGRADGTFTVAVELAGAGGGETGPGFTETGSTVRLTARADAAHWVANDTVVGLATEFASLLPFDVAVEVPVTATECAWRRITQAELPWRVAHETATVRSRALAEYCERVFGFTPLGHIDLDVPLAGTTGVAFILPQAVSPGAGQHRVYMKRMLLGPRVDRVLPEWAFFVRAVIDSDALSPTASREHLHDDEILLGVRESLGAQLKQWATLTLRQPGDVMSRFIETHHLALRALAVTDPDMLALVAEVLPFETSDGPMTLSGAASHGEIVYTATPEAYRRVAAVARAQELVVVNAGYVYDADIMERLGRLDGWAVRELDSADLVQVLGVPAVERELAVADAVARAHELLEDDDCDVLVRTFAPDTVPAILLRDSDGEHRRALDRERRATPDLWGGLLDAFAETNAGTRRTRTLVLNDASPVARRLLAAPGSAVFAAGLRSLYLSAVMLAGEGLRASESASLSDALGVLLDASLAGASERDAGLPHPSEPRRPEDPR